MDRIASMIEYDKDLCMMDNLVYVIINNKFCRLIYILSLDL
jgi:hypothetical protein